LGLVFEPFRARPAPASRGLLIGLRGRPGRGAPLFLRGRCCGRGTFWGAAAGGPQEQNENFFLPKRTYLVIIIRNGYIRKSADEPVSSRVVCFRLRPAGDWPRALTRRARRNISLFFPVIGHGRRGLFAPKRCATGLGRTSRTRNVFGRPVPGPDTREWTGAPNWPARPNPRSGPAAALRACPGDWAWR
jgi:hypothetical protein